jgi:hypothetical protein
LRRRVIVIRKKEKEGERKEFCKNERDKGERERGRNRWEMEKLDVLEMRGCVLEVVLLGNEGQAAFALARANCFVISKEYY